MGGRWQVMAAVLGTFLVFATCQKAYAEAAEPPEEPAQKEARAGLVVTRAASKGVVIDGLARFHMTLETESHRRGEQSMLLFAPDVAVTDWSVKNPWFGARAHVRRTERGVEFVVGGKGKRRLSLDFVVRVTEERLGRKVTVPIVRALASSTMLTVPGTQLEFEAEPKVSMELKALAEATAVTIYGGEGQVVLSWSPKAPLKVFKPVVFADQTMRVRVGRGVMRMDSAIDYSIVQGSVKDFEISFPADCSLLKIEGKDIRSWDVVEPEGPGPRMLKVALLGEVEKGYALALSLEKVLPDIKMELALPAVEALGVVREKGHVAVSAARGISVEAVTLENISHVDVREMMALPRVAPEEEVRLGFRYLKRPFTLRLRTGEVVAKTSVEILTLARAAMDSMRLTSSFNYTIRDAGVFQFRLSLDDGLKLIDIDGPNINNWQLDQAGRILTVALRSKAEGQYRLQIETELEKVAAGKALVPAVHALDVDRETGYIALLPAPGMKVETAALSGISQVDVKELPAELLKLSPALAYRYIRPNYQVSVNVSEIEPEVQAEVQTIATLSAHELSLHTEIHYTIRRAGIFQLRVAISKDLRRTNIEGEDIDDTSWDEKEGVLTVNLRSKVTGNYVLKIETEKTLEEIGMGVELPALVTVGVKKERGYLAVVTQTSVRVKPAEGKMIGLDDVSVSDLPPEMLRRAGQVALGFKYFTQPWSLALAVERIEPRVSAESFNLLSIGEKLMSVSATVNYRILHAGVDTFCIKLPPGATAVDIDGEAIKHREQDNGTWMITLQSKREDSYALYVSFQQKLSKDETVIPYSGVEALKVEGETGYDIERKTGYLALTSRPDVELMVADQDVENLTPIDGREIPESYLQGVTLPVLLAFRYVSHPYTIRIAALAHDAADVTVAVVESARLSTTITQEGNTITDMVCLLRNSRQQHLNLKLPKKAKIWHAFVAGEAVTPLKEGEITKIFVARAQGSNAPFEVRLRYSHSRENELGRLGSLRLDSPLQDIDIMRLGWTLSLPEGYDIVRDTGNIRRLESHDLMEAGLQRLSPDAEVQVSVRARKSAAAAAGWNPQLDYNIKAQEAIEQDVAGGSQRNPSIYTGSKPTQRERFFFQSLIVSARKPAWVEAQYVKGSVGIPLRGVVVLLVAGICGLVWRLRTAPRIARVAVVLGCALTALAVRTLAEGAYRNYLTAAIITLLAVAGVMLLCTIGAWMRDWSRRWAERRADKAAA